MVSRPTKGRSLPATIVNPQVAPPPPNILTISLAAIEIYLEYTTFPPQGEEEINEECFFTEWCSEAEVERETLPYTHTMGWNQASNPPSELKSGFSMPATPADSQPSPFSQLFDFGLQKLIFAGAAQPRQIQIIGKNTLQDLSKLAPAIFSAGYRDVCQSPNHHVKQTGLIPSRQWTSGRHQFLYFLKP